MHTITGDTREVPATGVFVAIGHLSRTELVAGQLELDAERYLAVLQDADSIATALVEEPIHG